MRKGKSGTEGDVNQLLQPERDNMIIHINMWDREVLPWQATVESFQQETSLAQLLTGHIATSTARSYGKWHRQLTITGEFQ